jgi:uncharacterized protein YecE (DUF72 family)
MARAGDRDQLSLFPREAPAPPAAEEAGRGGPRRRAAAGEVGAAPASDELVGLGGALARLLRLGGSTWSYPGWAGLVYDRKYGESKLAREGLAAYARHPLLRAVGLDRTHYAPLPAGDFAAYAAAVPADFRFLVKAHEALTLAAFPDHPRYGAQRGRPNPLFLDTAYAAEKVVGPYVEGLGAKGGALLFQFAPQALGGAERFAERLAAFLAALPAGPLYAVEVRNRELLSAAYASALAAAGACHCHNVFPRMPDLATQAGLAGSERGPATVVRWLVRPGMTYEETSRGFSPFDHTQAPDPETRKAVAALAGRSLAAGRPFLCTINNNAEGSAPLSIAELAREIVEGEGGPA